MKMPYMVNSLWRASVLPEARAFARGMDGVEITQGAYLRALLTANRDTDYGRRHDFAGIRDPAEYNRRVPVVDYEDIEPEIRSAALGQRTLTAEPTLLLEPTGGTRGGSKFIPYTASLREEFKRGLAPWIADLFRRHPRAMRGTAYWSLSPPLTRMPPFPSTVPVGFDSDAGYLGFIGRWMEALVFSVPRSVLRDAAPADFLARTATRLLADGDLALISVWNPTFLSLILEKIRSGREAMLREIRDLGMRSRARTAEAALDDLAAGRGSWTAVWPRLEVISCWRSGWAAGPARGLEADFPGVHLQAKGLLATEAFVSLPLSRLGGERGNEDDQGDPGGVRGAQQHVLAYRSHYFEFQDVESGEVLPAWEVRAGGNYSVLVTTGGGLYRYRLRDRVRIEGFRGTCPVLTFLAKEDSFSDLTGEKLQADFVQACCEKVLREAGTTPGFFLLAPEPEGNPPAYAFYPRLGAAPGVAEALGRRLDSALAENFQYRVSRELGQLGPVRVLPVGPGAESDYYYYKSKRAKLGDIKWKPLESPGPWSEILGCRPA